MFELADTDSDSECAEVYFEDFLQMVSRIVVHELDEEDAFFEEMKDAFRMYDKEVKSALMLQ